MLTFSDVATKLNDPSRIENAGDVSIEQQNAVLNAQIAVFDILQGKSTKSQNFTYMALLDATDGLLRAWEAIFPPPPEEENNKHPHKQESPLAQNFANQDVERIRIALDYEAKLRREAGAVQSWRKKTEDQPTASIVPLP